MPSDVCILVADPASLAAVRDNASLPGRVMPFPSTSVGSALESVRAYRPKVVAVDAPFAQSVAGANFLDRVEALKIPGGAVFVLFERDGRWTPMPRGSAASRLVAAAAPVVSTPPPAIVVSRTPPPNTRRVPRFEVRGAVDIVVEAGMARLVDMSVLGAQLVSGPVLRPCQKVKVQLPDAADPVSLVASVAWSTFERPHLQMEPHYRVGLEFTGAARQALEAYRRRYCAEQPIPYRGR